MSPSAYIEGLKLLGRRELSEAQVRQRLARRGFEEDAIDEAVKRLKDERALDDERVAGAIARTETSLKKRGRLRVRRQIENAGISASIARRAVEETFVDLDEPALLDQALAKRLRRGAAIRDEREFARLYRHLIAQGFAHDRVVEVLRKRRAPKPRA